MPTLEDLPSDLLRIKPPSKIQPMGDVEMSADADTLAAPVTLRFRLRLLFNVIRVQCHSRCRLSWVSCLYRRPVGAVALAEKEGVGQAHHEAEGAVEKREEVAGGRPQRQRDCATL